MKKILSAADIRLADQYTIKNEPISDLDLMERASEAFVREFLLYWTDIEKKREIHIICGPGNNGGDGFAIGRLLRERGFAVMCYLVSFSDKLSPSCKTNMDRFGHVEIISSPKDFPLFSKEILIIEAIFGSGLSRPATGLVGEIIQNINNSGHPVVSVDIPGGLFADTPTPPGAIVKADFTITFECPKLSFFLKGYGDYVGDWSVVDIGLDQEYTSHQLQSPYYWLEDTPAEYQKPRKKFSYKGDYGHVYLIAGSYGKMGAAVLAGESCLAQGVGLLTAHIPKCGYEIMQISIPRAMCTVDDHYQYITKIPYDSKKTYAIGPGLSTDIHVVEALEEWLPKVENAMVLDADALNIISARPHLWESLPQKSIITPHIGEFDRLFGKHENSFSRLKTLRKMAIQKQVIIVLKGAYTAICDVDGRVYFNSSGGPHLAQAGSGDRLTGIIAAYLAQGYSSLKAALMGVYFHGLSSDMKIDN